MSPSSNNAKMMSAHLAELRAAQGDVEGGFLHAWTVLRDLQEKLQDSIKDVEVRTKEVEEREDAVAKKETELHTREDKIAKFESAMAGAIGTYHSIATTEVSKVTPDRALSAFAGNSLDSAIASQEKPSPQATSTSSSIGATNPFSSTPIRSKKPSKPRRQMQVTRMTTGGMWNPSPGELARVIEQRKQRKELESDYPADESDLGESDSEVEDPDSKTTEEVQKSGTRSILMRSDGASKNTIPSVTGMGPTVAEHLSSGDDENCPKRTLAKDTRGHAPGTYLDKSTDEEDSDDDLTISDLEKEFRWREMIG